MKKIYLASPHMSEEKYEEKYIKEAFDTNWLSTVGENLNKFEESVREYLGVKASVAVASGTAGIHLGLKVLGVEKDDIINDYLLTNKYLIKRIQIITSKLYDACVSDNVIKYVHKYFLANEEYLE